MTKPLSQILREQQALIKEQQQQNIQLEKEVAKVQALNEALLDKHKELFQKEQDCQKYQKQLEKDINTLQNQLQNQQGQNQNNDERNLRILWQNTALQIAQWKVYCQGHLDLPWN